MIVIATTTSNASPTLLPLDELKREREFYRARGEVCPKDLPQANEEDPQQDDKAVNDTDYHRLDEQVPLSPYCSTFLLIFLSFWSYFCSCFVSSTSCYSFLFIFLHSCLPLPIILYFFISILSHSHFHLFLSSTSLFVDKMPSPLPPCLPSFLSIIVFISHLTLTLSFTLSCILFIILFSLSSQVNICLECKYPTLAPLKRRFIRCSAQATITHLKKFLALKVLEGPQKYREVRATSVDLKNKYWEYKQFIFLCFCFLLSPLLFSSLLFPIMLSPFLSS